MTDTQSAQAGNAAEIASRKRERIGIVAARTAQLAGPDAERFIRYVRDSLVLRPLPEASGAVVSRDSGIRMEFVRQCGPFLLIPVVAAFLAFWERDLWPALLFVSVVALAFGSAVRFTQIWNWREKLNRAGQAVPAEAGVPIRIAADQLTVGSKSFTVADLKLETVDAQMLWRPRIFPSFRINQIGLATSSGPLVLDVRLIKNGQPVVDTLCDKLMD